MNKPTPTLEERTANMLRNRATWGENNVLCMKQYARKDEEERFTMGYSAFGVVLNVGEPVLIYIRDKAGQHMVYATIDACLSDRWVVD
jgi:hypothetical protein